MRLARGAEAVFIILFSAAAARSDERIASAASTQPATRPAAATSFEGVWDTTFGRMTCEQLGAAVTGVYETDEQRNRIEGQVAGARLTFQYAEADAAGEGWLELAADGRSFRGKWRENGEDEWGDWSGDRVIAAAAASFDGLWSTSYGRMRLAVSGGDVSGTYAWNGTAHIRGTLEGGRLRFSYKQPDGEQGTGEFTLGPGGGTFAGTWTTTTGGGGNWTGERIEPVAGRVWLVVLESNWETSLAEPEYSYGQMLRSFFTRLPSVQVRHRFVHNLDDFRRWSREVAYLAEPVVLYVSSHGTPEGLILGSSEVGADAIIDCLRDVPALRLLHFGSCLVMSGEIPRKITAARSPETRFPISGFTKTADWAGSAIVDFTYLELVLGRDLPPAQAGRLTRDLVKFAGDEPSRAISGSGLRVYGGDGLDNAVSDADGGSEATAASRPAEVEAKGTPVR